MLNAIRCFQMALEHTCSYVIFDAYHMPDLPLKFGHVLLNHPVYYMHVYYLYTGVQKLAILLQRRKIWSYYEDNDSQSVMRIVGQEHLGDCPENNEDESDLDSPYFTET
ncbi:hypothetical protein AVEN_260724-1 [Araneus ventricosus]|uniref:Uncharacterized protein n=1 Tax=Araneus ventricosus TaxID=182803 RepID=A0A4Y2P0P2_ARAVE|nr:hypothetical protein AVEN_260724-1 [Araneus ventricosus]